MTCFFARRGRELVTGFSIGFVWRWVDSDSRIPRSYTMLSFAMLIVIHLHIHIDYLESRIICTLPHIGYVSYIIQVIYNPNHQKHRANVAIEQQTRE